VTGQVVGYVGELHPSVCKAFGLPARTSAGEIDLDALIELAPGGGEVAAISSYPLAKEDVALIVDGDVPAGEVAAVLRSGAGPLLESVRLFDVYVGEQIGAGKKSLAFALRFRAPDRTLTDAEAAAARDAAVAAAVQSFGAVQRTAE
jgi:phenylalanyl-tRNA synthetase beta chain